MSRSCRSTRSCLQPSFASRAHALRTPSIRIWFTATLASLRSNPIASSPRRALSLPGSPLGSRPIRPRRPSTRRTAKLEVGVRRATRFDSAARGLVRDRVLCEFGARAHRGRRTSGFANSVWIDSRRSRSGRSRSPWVCSPTRSECVPAGATASCVVERIRDVRCRPCPTASRPAPAAVAARKSASFRPSQSQISPATPTSTMTTNTPGPSAKVNRSIRSGLVVMMAWFDPRAIGPCAGAPPTRALLTAAGLAATGSTTTRVAPTSPPGHHGCLI